MELLNLTKKLPANACRVRISTLSYEATHCSAA